MIVWPKMLEKFRCVVLSARLMRVTGKLQREGIVTHIVADKIEDLSDLLDSLGGEEGFQLTFGLGDAVTNPAAKMTHAAEAFRAIPSPRHPREQAKTIFPGSRDFH